MSPKPFFNTSLNEQPNLKESGFATGGPVVGHAVEHQNKTTAQNAKTAWETIVPEVAWETPTDVPNAVPG